MKYLSILMVGVALLAGGCGEVEVSDGTEIVYLDDGSKGKPLRSRKPPDTFKAKGMELRFGTTKTDRRVRKSPTWTKKSMARRLGTTKTDRSIGKPNTWTAKCMVRRFLTARDGSKASETPHVDDKVHGTRGLRTARTDLSGLKPYTKTAKRSPEKFLARREVDQLGCVLWPMSSMVEATGVN